MPSRGIMIVALVALCVAVVQPDAAAHPPSDAARGLVYWNVANSSFLIRGGPTAVLTGNWDGVGGTGVGVAESYGGADWEKVLRDQLSTGPPRHEPYRYGSNACRPVSADWDGIDGATVGVACKDGMEWRWSLRNANSSGVPSYATFGYGNNACVPVTGDWNGDGTATIGVVCKGNLLLGVVVAGRADFRHAVIPAVPLRQLGLRSR